ncbi:kiSS-1 receptor [Strongylocentrotus purpuratus]|uniref:G-protein coupled receptors family 1 profile domain-containing protein n=1 Tax=Strongylocentrotus purpuratus TaxID=7668 RepID=A0A7M7SX64_STRPU|nr:kiSS-1 receptor [Strongylocentrotus purpuratus]
MVAECSRVFLSISCNQSMSNLPDDLASRLDTTSTIAFALMLIIIFFGLIGNLLIVYIVCTKPKMITVHNVHVVNLAVIDIVFLCVCSVVDVIGMGVIAFQDGLLSISHSHSAGIMFVQTLTFTAACGTLIALAFQRYLAIVRPLENKKRRTVKNANILQTLVWTGMLDLYYVFYVDSFIDSVIPFVDIDQHNFSMRQRLPARIWGDNATPLAHESWFLF